MRIVFVLAGLVAVLVFAAACGDDDAGGDATPTETQEFTASPTEDPAAFSFDCAEAFPGSAPDASAFPAEITDGSGRLLTIEAAPQAIASLSAGHTEILYAIGAADAMTAVDNTSDCPAAVASLEHVDAFSPSVESIVALGADVVVLFFDPGDLVQSLEDLGVTVLMMPSPSTIAGVYEQIEVLGDATGHAAEADTLIASMRVAVSEITNGLDALDAPTFFHEVDNTYYTAGPGSFIADLYDQLGAENIAEATGQPFPQMSAEAIIAADPQVIILADEDAGESADTVAARPGWGAIAAVQDGRVHVVSPDIVSRPGPRLVEALETLAGYLYPELPE
ncbi:MAG: ABC transporter substrate-binding protein [Chloroflexi bacterium]|nr:ABC transporter substrate-binding protein [Chloroflexota bacterium]